jgi:outer membrane receptor protein involved in Fe transport
MFAAERPGQTTIAGVVRDHSGEGLPGVTVTAARTGDTAAPAVVTTEVDGSFRLGELKPGSYVLETTLDGFQQVSKTLTLVTGQKLELAFTLVPAFGETVEVVAKAVQTGEVAVLESRRQSAVVSDSISAEEIRRTPDSNAASVVERLTGVTILDNKYVFVRGLGERYSGTTINGATLPTTETEKRVVPLDLFPAKLLNTVNVVKTYTPDKPGDFGSGIVEMTTTEFPKGASVKATLGSSYQSGTTGNRFRRYAGGLSTAGNGGQRLPSIIPDTFLQRKSILSPVGFSPEELEKFGEALVGDWSGRTTASAPPATDFALTFGDTLGRVGLVFSAVSNHGYETTDEVQRFFAIDSGGVLVPSNDYKLTTDQEHASLGLVGNFSLRLADNHSLFLNSVLTRDAASEDRFQAGLQTSSGGDIRDTRVRYKLEEIRSNRLRGEHNLGGLGLGSLVEWSVARSSASNDSDLRENIYREGSPGVFQLQPGFAESGKTEYFRLGDKIGQEGLAYTLFFAAPEGTWSGSFKAGADHLRRTRDFGSRRFRFGTSNQGQFDLTLTPEEIFTPANIRPGGFEIREVTGVNDAYAAGHTINAGYLMGDFTFGKWRVIGGARYESSRQLVTTFNPFDTANDVRSINENRDLLPSFNLVYQLQPKTNLRFAYGRSLNRPEFRELSPFTFVEVSGGRSVSGNPKLQQATLESYDVRWETFPGGGDVFAASAFYKKIGKPIERSVQPTTDFRTSFINADSATLWGLELEVRRSLASMLPALRLWSVNLNVAHIKSDVKIGAQQLSVLTSSSRPLEGQSDDVANVGLQYYRPQSGTMLRLLGAYSGKRITDVGAFTLPDIYEAAHTTIDVVVSQDFHFLAKGLELKLSAKNLLDQDRRFLQGGAVQRSYKPGRSVGLSLSYTPF